jgi:DNA-directed RNA polymerase specialized sigma24 family protein
MSASSNLSPGHAFTRTHWSEIQAARTASPDSRRAVLDNLARRYWRPVFLYLRVRGMNDADAADLTQGFFAEVVLGRDLFGQADPQRGRFRWYLLHCLKNFVRESHRRDHARCRASSRAPVSIDRLLDSRTAGLALPDPHRKPDEVFDRGWAVSLLEQVVDRLRECCLADGLEAHYDIFAQRFIRPALENTSPPSLEMVAAGLGLTKKEAANRAQTIRRRFRKLLLQEIRLTVTDENAAEDELRALLVSLNT